jgi:hypothetical protein
LLSEIGVVRGLMESLNAAALGTPASGFEVVHRIDFAEVFTDASAPERIEQRMTRLLTPNRSNDTRAEVVVGRIRLIHRLLSGDDNSRAGSERPTPTARARARVTRAQDGVAAVRAAMNG